MFRSKLLGDYWEAIKKAAVGCQLLYTNTEDEKWADKETEIETVANNVDTVKNSIIPSNKPI